MTRSTVKKLEEPLDETERELHRRRKAASRQQWNESLAIAERNLFDDETSYVINTEVIVLTKPMNADRPSKCAYLEGTSMTTLPSYSSIKMTISHHGGTYDEERREKKVPSGSLEARTTTRDPPYPTPSNSTTIDNTNKTIEEEGPKDEETTTIQNKETPQSPNPSKSSSVPFPSRLKK
ncbi:hypothetical protein Tco_0179687 [Tanacetum coccineum]